MAVGLALASVASVASSTATVERILPTFLNSKNDDDDDDFDDEFDDDDEEEEPRPP